MRFAISETWPIGWQVGLLALAMLPAACGEPPKPFSTPMKSTIAAASVPASPRAALRIRGIDNVATPGGGTELSQYLALALQDQGFTASLTGGFKGNFLLDGALRAPRESGAVMIVSGRWSLYHPDGRLYFEAASHTRLTIAEFYLNTGIGYRRIARDAARAIESRLYLYEAGAARRPELPALAVDAVAGAPGDGNRQLTTAIAAALAQAGVNIGGGPQADGYLLRAQVALGKGKNGRTSMVIVWRVIRPDQSEIGRFVQTEEVTLEPPKSSWRLIAGGIAVRARNKIVDLLQRPGSAGTK